MKLDKRVFTATASGLALLTTALSWAEQTDKPNAKNPNAPSNVAAAPQPAPQPSARPPTQPTGEQGQPAASPSTPADQAPQTATAGEAALEPAAAPVAAAPQQPLVGVAPVAPEPLAGEPVQAPAPSLPTKLALGKDGFVQVGALLQAWFDTQWNSDLPSGASHNTQSTFRARRAELKLYGDIVRDTASFMVVFDPAATLKFSTTNYTVPNGTSGTQTFTTSTPPGNTAALKVFWVSLKSKYLDAAIGQFKTPMSYEGQNSSAELIFPERAYSSLYFGDKYDLGIRLEKKIDWIKYQVFLLNGAGQNQLDKDKLQKDLSVRLEFTPIEGITVGTAGMVSMGQRATQKDTKDTVEFFGRVTTEGLLVQGELLWGENGVTAGGGNRTKAAGRYVVVGYTIADKIQPVIRYGYLNTDRTTKLGDKTTEALYAPFGIASDEVRSYEIGLNYLVQGNNLKLQAAYGYYDFDKNPFGQPALQKFTFSGQAAF